jgi:hypothetical protein
MHQLLCIAIGEHHVVNEVANMRIDLPRRHALGKKDFTDHRRPAEYHRVAVHRERRDAAFTVAARTVVANDWRDVVFVRRQLLGMLGARGIIDGDAGPRRQGG